MKPRLAVRAVLLHEDRLLLVNAWADPKSQLWCAPGGGVELGQSLPDNLAREVMEETGLTISVGPPCLVNEFHDPERDFHQVELFFRCKLIAGELRDDWQDPEQIVRRRAWFTQDEVEELYLKPSSLPQVAWNRGFGYDPLERIVF
ncbi:NUDIX domain-containing protein [Aestuariivita boseongensis]|uniref:NUDIX domain-containing protein n=1 Tax=Aestuariivita boseongensis TaxID=1470562 RepID=UPI000A8C74FD|nr:NUDIX hydrolase [Aestuariivita boseongensis]